jgi:hypothetical protein
MCNVFPPVFLYDFAKVNNKYLFIYALFNDTFSSSYHVESDGRMIGELERMWKDLIVA